MPSTSASKVRNTSVDISRVISGVGLRPIYCPVARKSDHMSELMGELLEFNVFADADKYRQTHEFVGSASARQRELDEVGPPRCLGTF